MPITIPPFSFVFAGESGNHAASELDSNFNTLFNALNNIALKASDISALALRSYLAGCILSNDGGAPNTTIDVSAGSCTSDDQTTGMLLSAITGTTGGTWVVGTGQPKLDTGSVAINTWYHVYVIQRTDTGVVDILFSTNATSPSMPASYTKKRRIGSFKTAAGTTNILAFTQDGDYFRWAASVNDVSANNPGTAAVTATLASVPLGVNVQAYINPGVINTAGVGFAMLVSDLAANDEAPSVNSGNPPGVTLFQTIANNYVYNPVLVRTNTSQQVRYRLNASDGNTTVKIHTLGWWDTRGRNA